MVTNNTPSPGRAAGLPPTLERAMEHPWVIQNRRYADARPWGVEAKALASLTLAAAARMGVRPHDLVGTGPGGRYNRRGVIARWLVIQSVKRAVWAFSPSKVNEFVFAAGARSNRYVPSAVEEAIARGEIDERETPARVMRDAEKIMAREYGIRRNAELTHPDPTPESNE